MTDNPIALETYEALADEYAARIDKKPHNAFYDRPAVLSLFPGIKGLKVLDAGCGPGVYTEEIVKRGAVAVGIDVSPRMLELARTRLGGKATFICADLSKPLDVFRDAEFEVIVAPLCLDYVKDWRAVFGEFFRVLKPGGCVVMSAGHPSFDAEYYNTKKYFGVEKVACDWNGFGKKIRMPSYRRSLEEFVAPVLKAGFEIDRLLEPLPTTEFGTADPARYRRLKQRPCFLCMRARKPAACS